MNKNLVRFICCFIPSKQMRKNFRHKYSPRKKVSVKLAGENNKIIIYDENGQEYINSGYEKLVGLNITVRGNNNIIKLHMPIVAKNSNILINNDNASIEIFPTPNLVGAFIHMPHGDGQNLVIGSGTTCWGCEINLANSSSCIIGQDCMLSAGIHIRGADNHSILDKDTGEILNKPAGPLIIGDHCWVGLNATITKNARIPNNTIIGTGAVVTKKFTDEYTALAGNPARVVSTNITWDRRDTDKLQRDRDAAAKK